MHGLQAKLSDPLLTADGTREITEPTKIAERWKEYFDGLLNEQTTTDESVNNELPEYPEHTSMSDPLTIEEVRNSIKNSTSNQSHGVNGIPAEILKAGGSRFK